MLNGSKRHHPVSSYQKHFSCSLKYEELDNTKAESQNILYFSRKTLFNVKCFLKKKTFKFPHPKKKQTLAVCESTCVNSSN